MIDKMKTENLDDVMMIWLKTNQTAHPFISKDYWENNFEMVKEAIAQAEVYVYKNKQEDILGFIGLDRNYIAGIFIKNSEQSNGIGKQLLDFVKERRCELSLDVYKENKRAVRFYQREQFLLKLKEIDENTGETEYHMEWKN